MNILDLNRHNLLKRYKPKIKKKFSNYKPYKNYTIKP